MKPKLVYSFLKVMVSVVFYLLIAIAGVFLFVSLLTFSGKQDLKRYQHHDPVYTYEVQSFGPGPASASYTYSPDSLMRYHGNSRFTLEVESRSAAGYYSLIGVLIFLGIGICILWNFRQIFREASLEHPFRRSVSRRLRMLAALFIVSDLFNLLNYFLLNSFIKQSIASPHLKLITKVGDGFIIGLVVWIIAVVYQRGIDLQEENALTV